MQIPSIPNYNSLIGSGCSFDLLDTLKDGSVYGPVLEYDTEIIPIISMFDIVVYKEWGVMLNYPVMHKLQHLVIDDEIDYLSFISLN